MNLQPVKKEIELTGLVFKNKEIEILKTAFPHKPRMWSVEQFWPDAKLYVDRVYFECDRDEYTEKQKVMKAHGLEYRFE